MPLQFVKSAKGKHHLIVDGFRFVKDREGLENTFWKCAQYHSKKCSGRAVTSGDNVVRHDQSRHCHTNENVQVEVSNIKHSLHRKVQKHFSNFYRLQVMEVLSASKNRAETTVETPHSIIAASFQNVSPHVAPHLPHPNSIKKQIRRIRQKHELRTADPPTRADIEILFPYTKTGNFCTPC